MNSSLIPIHERNFDAEVSEFGQPVLVEFGAPWCGPCKMIAPILQELAVSFAGRAKIGIVNVDDSPELAQRFGITHLPTLLLFGSGEARHRVTGLASKRVLSELLSKGITSAAAVAAKE